MFLLPTALITVLFRVLCSCVSPSSSAEPAAQEDMPPLEGEGEGEDDDVRMEEVD